MKSGLKAIKDIGLFIRLEQYLIRILMVNCKLNFDKVKLLRVGKFIRTFDKKVSVTETNFSVSSLRITSLSILPSGNVILTTPKTFCNGISLSLLSSVRGNFPPCPIECLIGLDT